MQRVGGGEVLHAREVRQLGVSFRGTAAAAGEAGGKGREAKNGHDEVDLFGVDDGGSVGCVTAGRQKGSAAGTEQRRSGGSANDISPVVTVGRRAVEDLVEDHCHLPTLQDMLEDFDVSKLEELAETLLADVGADLESADRPSSPADAEGSRTGKCLPGPVVGSAAAVVESGRPAWPVHSGSRLILTTHNYSKSPFHEQSEGSDERKATTCQDAASPVVSVEPPSPCPPIQTTILPNSGTLYGTYDNETNCITIILSSEEEDHATTPSGTTDHSELTLPEEPQLGEDIFMHEATSEAELEAICETSEPSETSSSLGPIFIRPPSPLQDLLSPIGTAHHALKSPGGFSSVSSDCGYESLGSPGSCESTSYPSASDLTIPTEDGCLTSAAGSGFIDNNSSLSLDYALNDFDEFWNLDLFPILE